MKRPLALLAPLFLAAFAPAGPITLTILHTDDLHGHVEPFAVGKGTYGGYARQMTLVKRYMAQDPNPLLLSGGDTFQGTLYFQVYQGLADLALMNLMGYHGMAVGNHEFDLGPAPLAEFARGARFPVLSSNIDVSAEPALRDLIRPYAIVQVKREKIGLVGATTPDLLQISSPGPNVRMLDLKESLRRSIAELQRQGVDKIILLSHLGYTLEKEVAAQVDGIDVIVGGHSHTLLGEFNNPDFPKSEGPYPTVVKGPKGDRTLLVAAWEWGKLLGRIKVDFDAGGRVARWRDAQPIVVSSDVPDDPIAQSAIVALRRPIESLRKTVLANAGAPLSGAREIVRREESPMGNAIADAMLDATKNAGAEIGLINGGGVRAGLDAGPVTYEEAIAVQPFGNTLVVLDLTGEELLRAMEHGVSGWEAGEGRFLHVSRGVRYVFDPTKPAGSRIVEATVAGAPIDRAKVYRVTMNNYMASGGDAFAVFKEAKGRRLETGLLDIDALVEFLKRNPNPSGQVEGRVVRRGA